MKQYKFRFVKDNETYYLQRKTWRGWRDEHYLAGSNAGSVWTKFYGNSKKDLLDKVLDQRYRLCKKHVRIVEYPTIKIY